MWTTLRSQGLSDSKVCSWFSAMAFSLVWMASLWRYSVLFFLYPSTSIEILWNRPIFFEIMSESMSWSDSRPSPWYPITIPVSRVSMRMSTNSSFVCTSNVPSISRRENSFSTISSISFCSSAVIVLFSIFISFLDWLWERDCWLWVSS